MLLKNLTWNIEGFSRNRFNLCNLIQLEDPTFIFIGEPWLHLPDALLATDQISNLYNFYLNSEDRHDDLLSLQKTRAHGGTMTLWKKELDPYITIHEPTSSRILALVLDRPGYQVSIHINIYLSTAGKEACFIEDLSVLEDTIDILNEKHPDSVLYIRGDANSSSHPRQGNKRDQLFQHFLRNNNLENLPINHLTYHHFTNGGLSDSSIDVILSSKLTSEGFPNKIQEKLVKVFCGKEDSLIDSSHDAILSCTSFPPIPNLDTIDDNLVTAPRVPSSKHKINWSEEGIIAYQELLSNTLPSLQLDTPAELYPETASILFQMTNHILTSAAKITNKSVDLTTSPKKKRMQIPIDIQQAIKVKTAAHKTNLNVSRDPASSESEKIKANNSFKFAKAQHQNITRRHNNLQECERDSHFNELIFSKTPQQVFRTLKSQKSKDSSKIKSLTVHNKVYTDSSVADGFFDSISELKTLDTITANSYERFSSDYKHIIEICKAGAKIPRISSSDSIKLLKKIRPSVADFFSVTAAHYINGGDVAINHFQFLINTVLDNIEIAAIDELNKTHAVILFKGHGKNKNAATSYRTISSCPFISKAVDIYLGQLSKDDWNSKQAETQFQGDGMSHELAALLLTITIFNSILANLPIFVLLLDAKSAFDLVLRKILIRRLYLDTKPDQRILYWDHRLANRTTFCQWDGNLMGPIKDQRGVEQGGPNSSDHYKIYNNEQISTAQNSGFGSMVGDEHVGSLAQADDDALVSNDTNELQHLLQLALDYCDKYQVELSAVKTKLLVFGPPDSDYVKYAKLTSPIHIGTTKIPFVDCAEHVGVLRSVSGNLPHLHQRIVNHRKALASILYTGMTRKHRANPLASLRAELIFGAPVLFSGTAALILNKSEIEIIAHHVKETIQNLLKLYPKTPDSFIFMISGSFPGEAQLHLKQLTLFGMICRLPSNILNKIARQTLISCDDNDKSWFGQIRSLCFNYGLPNPLLLLDEPPTKESYKKLIKTNIADFWQSKLRVKAGGLSSLKYFKPQYMSILRPHPMLLTSSHSHEVNKMTVQLRMLSGRYRVGTLLKHFSPGHSGVCELCGTEIEDLVHLLLPRCPLLKDRRTLLVEYAYTILGQSTTCINIFSEIINSNEETQVQFFLDCSVIPSIIRLSQNDKNILPLLFKVCRTWCYSLHRTRLKLLGRWNTT